MGSEIIVNGICLGSMYGIAAIGLSLIFGTMRIVFISQGAVIVLFAYFSFWLFRLLGLDPYLSIIPNIIAAFLIGMAMYYFLFRETAALKDRIGSLLLAVGLMFALENFMTLVWSPDPRAIVTSYGYYKVSFFGLESTLSRVIGLLMAILSTAGVSIFLKRTFIGTAVRAISEDLETSTLMGINPDRVNTVAFAIGIALASIAGVNLATTYSFDPVYGFDFAIKGLIALTLGGIGTVAGVILGGIFLGIIEVSSGFYFGSGWAQAIVFIVFILFLILRPQGFFGKAEDKA